MPKLNLNKIAGYTTLAATALALPSSTLASNFFNPPDIDTENPAYGFKNMGDAVATITAVIFFFAALAAFFFILLGAFNYLTAGDDAGKTEKARKMITNAVVGLILVALVFVIWQIAISIIPGLNAFINGD